MPTSTIERTDMITNGAQPHTQLEHQPNKPSGVPVAFMVIGGHESKWPLLLLNIFFMVIGGAGPILTRVYFLHGGTRLWLSSQLQVCGFPVLVVPLSICYLHRRRRSERSSGVDIILETRTVAAACVVIGVMGGLNAYMYALGSSYLPLSTSSLLISTQLAFTAGFAYLLVRQRFTAYSVNAVVLLVLAAVVLGLQSGGGDRPVGESDGKYYLGFAMMIGAAALLGLLMPLTELTYVQLVEGEVTYALVMETQVIMGFFGSVVCAVGMLVNKDLQAIPKEAEEFGLGEAKYYLVLVFCAISWQFYNLGYVGVISCSSSLFTGIVTAALIPVGGILPVFLLHEKFHSEKGVALFLSLWGFTSYLYGEHKKLKRMHVPEVELNLP